jgi:hypothetical protein
MAGASPAGKGDVEYQNKYSNMGRGRFATSPKEQRPADMVGTKEMKRKF